MTATKAVTKRERLATYGDRGRLVRVLREPYARAGGALRVRVQWTEPRTGKLKTRSYPDASTASMKAARRLAEDLAVRLRGTDGDGPPPITLGALWERFAADQMAHLRPLTRRNYRANWALAVNVLGPRTRADAVRATDLVTLRNTYRTRAKPLAHRSIQEAVAIVRHVIRWGVASDLVPKDVVSAWRYQIAKEERRESPPEYSAAEYAAILAQLSPARRDQWRAWAALTVAGQQGVRANAVLHLAWADVDLEGATLTWRARYDKNGQEWTQPLRAGARAALVVARAYARTDAYAGPWVFFPGHSRSQQETWTYDALYKALVRAEAAAGVPHLAGRAAHALRRRVAGDVAEATGDAVLAMQAIGDRDVRMAQRYVKTRQPRVRAVFDQLDAARPDQAAADVTPTRKRVRPTKGGA